MSTPVVITEQPAPGVGLIRINRPEARNALNMAVRQLIAQHLSTMADDDNIRAIVLTGNEKAFAAGADIKEMAEASTIDMLLRGTQKLWRTIYGCPKPVIAAVNGFALGGGCELAMACHMRICSSNAKFGQPEVNLGLIPGYGGTQRLTQLIGKAKSMELQMTAQVISAEEALQLKLVNYVTTIEELINKSTEILLTIQSKAPFAISKIIECVNIAVSNADAGYKKEVSAFGDCFETEDMKEGTTAFLEKRKANFTGK